MRLLARIGYTLAGLALAAPAAALAGAPGPAAGPTAYGTQPQRQKVSARQLKSRLGRGRLCAECQRTKLKTETGVNMPPAPPLPPGLPVAGEKCAACGATAVVMSTPGAPAVSQAQLMTAASEPGRAVVGGEAESAYASVGSDPMPIGAVGARTASAIPMPARGSRDASVAQTSMASDPVAPKVHNRPHVLSHLLGIDTIGRERAETRARRAEEKHASIPYGSAALQPVTELPASVVYGRR